VFTVSRSRSRALTTAKDCAAKASLSSIKERSLKDKPACLRALGTASTGPIPMYNGSTPATAHATSRAWGSKPNSFIFCADMTNTKAAPSEVCELFPAVTVPPTAKAGFNLDKASILVSRRTPSSTSMIKVRSLRLSSSTQTSWTLMGAICALKTPLSMASPARIWLRTANKSASSREMSYFDPTASAVRPIPTK